MPTIPFSVITSFLGLCPLTWSFLTSFSYPQFQTQLFLHSGWLREDWGPAVLKRRKRMPVRTQRTVPETGGHWLPCPGRCHPGLSTSTLGKVSCPLGPWRCPLHGCWRSGVPKGGGKRGKMTELCSCSLPQFLARLGGASPTAQEFLGKGNGKIGSTGLRASPA